MLFTLIDQRKQEVDKEIARLSAISYSLLGIEVTIPRFAALCLLGNIDPQHTGKDASQAAIEAALTWPLPPEDTTLVTVRPDLDSIGAMAVLKARSEGVDFISAMARIEMVAKADRFEKGGWPGPQPLPTRENPWPVETGTASLQLAAIIAAVSDFKEGLINNTNT